VTMPSLLILFSVAAFFAATLCDAKSYEGYSLYEVHPNTEAKVDYLISLGENPSGLEIQIWRPGHLNSSFDILVGPESKELFLRDLDQRHIGYEIKIENIQDSIEKERRPVSPRARAFAGVQNAAQFSKYLNLDEINDFIKSLATNFPNIVQIEEIGKSFEQRPIYVVKVGSENGKKKPSIWIDGGIHAREWIGVSTVTFMLNKLVTGYATDAKIKNFVDKANWYIVPVLNVDGYQFTHTEDRMWRKNRRPAPCRGCCEGVDLNRNFDHSFGGAGTSPDSCQDSYRGSAAFSEPETRAVRDFVLKHTGDMKAFITIHAYMQMWFYPYANKKQSYPQDVNELVAVSKKAVAAIKSVYGTDFTVGTPADILYPAAGGSFDWVKATAKVKYTFGMELRPNGRSAANGFILPPSQILPAGEETWAGISVVADEVIRQFA